MMKLELTRNEMCDLRLACFSIITDMKDEIKKEDTEESRKIVLEQSIKKWENLRSKIVQQMKEQEEQ